MVFFALLSKDLKSSLQVTAFWVLGAVIGIASFAAQQIADGLGDHAGLLREARADVWLGALVALAAFHGVILSRAIAEEKMSKVSEILLTCASPLMILSARIIAAATAFFTHLMILVVPSLMPGGQGAVASPLILQWSEASLLVSYGVVLMLTCGTFFSLASLYARNETEASSLALFPFMILVTQGMAAKVALAKAGAFVSFMPIYGASLSLYRILKVADYSLLFPLHLVGLLAVGGVGILILARVYKPLLHR